MRNCDVPRRHSGTPFPLFFEVDQETGRRPTLVVESTALLAVAESVDLEQSRRSSNVSCGAGCGGTSVYKPLGMGNRWKMATEEDVDGEAEEEEVVVDGTTKDSSISPSSSRQSSGKKPRTGGFIKLRSPGSALRKRMLERKRSGGGGGSGFPRLHFLSRSKQLSPSGGGGGGTTDGDETTKLLSEEHQPHLQLQQRQSCPVTSCSNSQSRRDSLYIFSHSDEPIVTPFAQILASLRKVRSNFIYLTNVSSSKE